MLNAALLTYEQKEELKQSYLQYLLDKTHSQLPIDELVYDILELGTPKRQKLMIHK